MIDFDKQLRFSLSNKSLNTLLIDSEGKQKIFQYKVNYG